MEKVASTASSGFLEVGVKNAANTPTFSPWQAQMPVQKGWCSKVGAEILKNTPTCTPGLRDPNPGVALHGPCWKVLQFQQLENPAYE